jgi:hypothetical protein
VKAVAILLAAAVAWAGPAEARARSFGPHVHTPRLHGPHAPRPPKPRRPDGTMVHCQRQTFSAADIDIACR